MSAVVPLPDDPVPGTPAEGSGADGADELALYALVAERLKQAHAQVRALDVSEATRASLTRSLLLVTEAAKRDLPEAARRLARFVDQLEGGSTPPRTDP